MWTHTLSQLTFSRWETWFILTSGLTTAVFVLLTLRTLVARRWHDHSAALRRQLPSPRSGERRNGQETAPAEATGPERRRSQRREGTVVKVFICPGEELERVFEGYVLDRSLGGLCLAVKKPVEAASVINVRAENAPETSPWVQVEVKSCRQDQKRWQLNCQFVETPPWNVLLLFG